MEGDIALIKGLLWATLDLLVLFVVGNVLCRVFNCGQPREPKYGEMWGRGDTRKLLATADDRLRTHPHDLSALYFSAKALAASGQVAEARSLAAPDADRAIAAQGVQGATGGVR